jgi:hypothetical protein
MGETDDRAARFAAEMAAAEFEDADELGFRFFAEMAEKLAQKARKSRAWQPLDPPKRKPGRKPVGGRAMSNTERSRRRRDKAKSLPPGGPSTDASPGERLQREGPRTGRDSEGKAAMNVISLENHRPRARRIVRSVAGAPGVVPHSKRS